MKIISNVEFEKLVEGQPAKLRALARNRVESSPKGFLTVAEIDTYINTFKYTGDKKSVQWLKNLAILHKNGKLRRIRAGAETFQDHVSQVHILYAAGQIPLDIGDSVQCKESGRYGSVVDYNPDSKEYIVVMSPFEMKNFKKTEITKVAQMEPDTWADDQVNLWVMNDEFLYTEAIDILKHSDVFALANWLQEMFSETTMMNTVGFDDNDVSSIDWNSVAQEIEAALQDELAEF